MLRPPASRRASVRFGFSTKDDAFGIPAFSAASTKAPVKLPPEKAPASCVDRDAAREGTLLTPGAVVTENTKYLEKTIFSVDSNKFVNNIIKFLGNVNGTTCAYWGHGFTLILINFFPFIKNRILKKVGDTISKEYMENFNLKKY